MEYKTVPNFLNLLIPVLAGAVLLLAGCTDETGNKPPVAHNDHATVNEGASRSISSTDSENVLSNDEDPDGDPLVVNTMPVTDVKHGTLTLHSDGSWEYEHDGSETTSDSFVYEISDGKGGTSRATVTIEINGINDAPEIVAQISKPLVVLKDESLELKLEHIEVVDPDSDTFTLLVKAGTNYTLNGNTVIPDANYSGPLTVPVSVSDGAIESEQFQLSVLVNSLPAAGSSCHVTTQANTLTGNLQGSDPDIGDSVTFALLDDNGSVVDGLWTTAQGGTVNLLDASTGSYKYTPPPGNGKRGITDTFQFQVTDGQSATASATETIKIGLNIMPLGDSITSGIVDVVGGNDTPVEAQRKSYRQPLYSLLTTNGYAVDFVGVRNDGSGVSPGYDFHAEGWSGITSEELAGAPGSPRNVTSALNDNPVDVVLLHIGTNDMSTTGVDDIEEILNDIDVWEQNNHPVTVVLAKIIDQWHRTDNQTNPQVTTLNNAIQAMVSGRPNDDIILVDMQNALSYPSDLGDENHTWIYRLHPKPSGYQKMANRWYGALTNLLDKCP